jgi:hypothetical protein
MISFRALKNEAGERSVLEDHLRKRPIAGMRDAHRNIFHSQTLGNRERRAVQRKRGFPAREPRHFDIHPAHAMRPPGSQRLHRRFFSGEASRVALHVVPVPLAVCDFARRVDAMQERLATPLNRRAQAAHLGQVHSQSDNHRVDCPALAVPPLISAQPRDYTSRGHAPSASAIGCLLRVSLA